MQEVLSLPYSFRKPLYGVGINDADYITQPTIIVDGIARRGEKCPYYLSWQQMIRRGYDCNWKKMRPSYAEVSVREDWHYFMRFRAWALEQGDIKGLHLDKDILNPGNKIYNTDDCAFVPVWINNLLATHKSSTKTSGLPIGVIYVPRDNSYYTGVNIEGKSKYIGSTKDPLLTHRIWQLAKADVIESVVLRYSKEDYYREDVGEAVLLRAQMLRDHASQGMETKSLILMK